MNAFMVPKNRRLRQERSMGKHRVSVLLAGALVALVSGVAWSQSNDVIDTLLSQERATLANVAYLVLTASGAVDETQSVDQAFAALQAKPWGFAKAAPDATVTFGSYAYLVMRAFGLRGGVMYTIFPGPRYAARELAYRQFLPGDTSPGRHLSGREATHVLGKVLELLGQRQEGEVQQ
jgi:hypothetical protein